MVIFHSYVSLPEGNYLEFLEFLEIIEISVEFLEF